MTVWKSADSSRERLTCPQSRPENRGLSGLIGVAVWPPDSWAIVHAGDALRQTTTLYDYYWGDFL